MARKSATAPSGTRRMIREKEDFRYEEVVNIDGQDVRCYAKCSVSYEKLTYKIRPVLTLVHDWRLPEVRQAFDALIDAATGECIRRLEVYRGEAGIGNQGDLFDQGEPSEG